MAESNQGPLQLLPVEGLPRIGADHDLARLLVNAVSRQIVSCEEGDVLCVAQKVVSKAEGRLISLKNLEPGPEARQYASMTGRDPRVVQAILNHSRSIIKVEGSVIIAETHHGFICANAGLDHSNLETDGTLLALPEDPDRSAQRIRRVFQKELNTDPAVIITDTWGRPWREGQVNFAIGLAGIVPIHDYRGQKDTEGRVLTRTRIALADEIAAAAELVMGKTRNVPAVVLRGYRGPRGQGSSRQLVRPAEEDFFRPD